MGVLVTVAVLIMFSVTIEETSAACCWSRWGLCGDCTWSTPYCGYRPCNFFGCACGGGCRSGTCFRKKRSTEDFDATNVFNVYDLDKNGKIEKVEFTAAFNKTGLTDDEWYAQWDKMDENKDGVITIDEFDH